MMRPRIGIVDDEAGMRDALVALLSENQFEPVPMESSADFAVVSKSISLDLVVPTIIKFPMLSFNISIARIS